MSFDITCTESGAEGAADKVVLAGDLCIFNAAEIKPRLFELIRPETYREVDLAQVSEVDTAGIQLLLMAKGEAARQGCTLSFVNHSDPMLEVIDLLRLSSNFGDPVVIPAAQETN